MDDPDLINVSAAVMCVDGKVLIARRAKQKHLGGYWEFPGGKVESGESVEDCLIREMKEEFGISVRVGDFIAENTHDYGTKVVRLLAFKVIHVSGEIQLTDHDRIEWAQANELLDFNLAPADVPIAQVIFEVGS